MKTYLSTYVLLALLVIGCSTSDDATNNGEVGKEQQSVDSDYVTLLTNGTNIKTQLLNANAELITLNPAESALVENTIPELTAIRGSDFFQYHKNGDCGGEVIMHNFVSDKMENISLFEDLNDCLLTAKAIAFSDSSLFVAYELEVDGSSNEYMVRVVDLNSTDFSFVDVSLSMQPVSLALANNRLFIMTFDSETSEENFLSVLDLDSNALIHEKNLGFRARRIFKNIDDNIIISYDELHTTLNSENLSVVFTNYTEETAPKFTTNTVDHFDFEGRLYYPTVSEAVSIYPEIPAVYDFSKKLVTLYAYENFLTEEKRDIEFEIETTTAINYDQKNDILIIGYKKTNKQEGGLLRIKPGSEPLLIDNIDLDGVPYQIFVN